MRPKRRTKSAHTQSETDATTAGSSDARQVSYSYGAFEDDSLLVDFANTTGGTTEAIAKETKTHVKQ